MSKVIVIGTGTMGVGIAAGFLAFGANTILLGRDLEKAKLSLPKVEACADSINPTWRESRAQLIAGTIADWSDWDNTDLIIETISERLELKQAIFSELDQRVPPSIPIGSNSSGFPISDIAQGLPTSHRMFNTHYFMPAHIVPLVEVVLGTASDTQMAEQVCSLYRAHGKKPVLVKRDIPGFLANRIQHALMREALSLVQEGIATPDDIDTAVRYSFGFRYAAVGPMTQKEISGWEGMALAAEVIYPSLSNITKPPAWVMDLVSSGNTGMAKGAGFREWSPEEAREMKQVYEMRLKAAFEVLKIAPELN
ncbi:MULTISPECIES: 3-hydroxyacyl-CoA dehydrogenase NAD-binding domain-containing protein [unclassified Polynucleobacter]|uniref:3-hydroxyacyl-CoA dehydrogenase family protein n=1 Tax=unclassified Polynucleobacter TaxID=2640945 RepID=UPI0008BF7E60|nr:MULTISPECIES: 3-hydroxyacyl-CoA dehydrogenase NAD-binding domain-containing protein [unclassified Polynucleobacter]OHC10539.1 MAG: 3-hydroxyacyl-CoA dehydrogenase [Polynucleobacter sp. GWA2_45_21]HBK44383.1 3-hydroxyacyl-CoA dehydrogenase [Polynucleobacter sp.]